MKIIDDRIQLDAPDISGLSKRLQDAAIFRAGPNNLPVEEYLSTRFNAILEECVNLYEKDLLASHPKTFLAFALADATIQDQVKGVLGVAKDADLVQPNKPTP